MNKVHALMILKVYQISSRICWYVLMVFYVIKPETIQDAAVY